MDKYLITGSTGFIGSNLARHLISKNKRVCVIVRDRKLNWRLKAIAKYLDIYECDLLSSSLQKVVNKIKPTYILHLATYGTSAQEEDMSKMVDVNIKGTINLFHALKNLKFKRFIHTSSSSEYGNKNHPIKEVDLLEPINYYGITKVASTLYCQKIAKIENLPITIFRLFSPYGYYEQKERLIPTIIKNASENKTILLSSPQYVRDFIFIEDVIAAYMKAVDIDLTPGEILNIGYGKQYTIQDVAKLIIKLTESKSSVNWGAIKKQTRQTEPIMWEANINKTKELLSWEPQYTLKQGLAKTIAWYSQNKHLYI